MRRVPFTADAAALAIVAAARAWGEEPEAILVSRDLRARQCLAAAGSALAAATGVRLRPISRALGIGYSTLCHAQANTQPKFQRARRAALRAVTS